MIERVTHHPDREPSRVPEVNNAPRRVVIADGTKPGLWIRRDPTAVEVGVDYATTKQPTRAIHRVQVLPVIHHLNEETTHEQALLAYEAGAAGVFIISHDGRNDELSQVAQQWASHSGMPRDFKLGVNFLGWSPVLALEVASHVGADMLWLDDPGVRSHGMTVVGNQLHTAWAAMDKEDRPQVFASVAFKYQPNEPAPRRAARRAFDLGYTPVTSGLATGEPPTVEKIADMARGDCGRVPLGVASGMTVENVAQFVPHLSHILVSSGVCADFHHFDFKRLQAFVQAVHDAA